MTSWSILSLMVLAWGAVATHAQTAAPKPPDHPSITFQGRTYTPRSIVERNMRSEADQTGQFPPHKIIGNIYYVGTHTLSSFLIVTPQGDFLRLLLAQSNEQTKEFVDLSTRATQHVLETMQGAAVRMMRTDF